MPRRRDPGAPAVVYRTARVALRTTRAQRRRLFGLLRSGGDVWAAVLELNRWRGRRGIGRSWGIRSCVGNWNLRVRYPRRRRGLVPVRFSAGTFTIQGDGDGVGSGGQRVRLPVARGRPPLWVRPARPLPYPADSVRSVRLVNQGRRLFLDVTAEVPVATYPAGAAPDRARVAGVDLGIIHPYAVLAPRCGEGGADAALLVSGRALRAEHRLHLAESKARARATAARAPRPGQTGSRRWRRYRARSRRLEGRHRRRLAQARHEAATQVVSWAVQQRVGTLVVGDARGLLDRSAGRRQNKAVRDWAVGHLLATLTDKAQVAGIAVEIVDERGTSSTCPACRTRVPRPRGRVFSRSCRFTGHRDLVGAANIAARATTTSSGPGAGDGIVTGDPPVTTHRRAGRHLPGAGRSRRDPRRALLTRPPGRSRAPTHPVGRDGESIWPAVARPPSAMAAGSRSPAPAGEDQQLPHREHVD